MTPTLRTAILAALMERWRESATVGWAGNEVVAPLTREQSLAWPTLQEPIQRDYLSSCLDMILPVAEPMIREAALREAAGVVQNDAIFSSDPNEIDRAERMETAILALGEHG